MITIYGASDDLVEVDGCEGAGEFGTDHLVANLIGPGATEQLHVTCWYDDNGTWQVSVGQVSEDVPLAPWPLRIRQGVEGTESDYSAVLEIDAPAGTRIDVEASNA